MENIKKILVTGAAGFIGFHLTERLLSLGYEVVGLDNINNYYDVNLKYARLNESGIAESQITYGSYVRSSKYVNYSFIQLNLTDQKSIEKCFSEHDFDAVCNLAAQAGVRYSIEQPREYIDSNIVGFMNVLEACRHNKVKHLVYASSSSVYGLNSKQPFSTDDKTDSPISLYAATKKSNELMAHCYSHLYGFCTTGLRFFTVYGPWGRPDMAPVLFADAISSNKAIKVFNNGNLERDFTYIDDIINGMVNVLLKGGENTNHQFKLYNIGNNKPVKLLRFIEEIEKNLQKIAIKEFLPMQAGDVYSTYANIDPLDEDFSYRPKVQIEDGIKKFIDWFKLYYKVGV